MVKEPVDQRIEQLKEENRNLKKELSEKEVAIDRLKREAASSTDYANRCSSQIAAAGKLLSDKKQECVEMMEKYNALKKEYEEMKKNDNELIDTMKKEVDAKITLADDLSTRLKEMETENEMLRKEMKEMVTVHRSRVYSHIMEPEEVFQLLSENQQELDSVKEQLLDLKKELDITKLKKSSISKDNKLYTELYAEAASNESSYKVSNEHLKKLFTKMEEELKEELNQLKKPVSDTDETFKWYEKKVSMIEKENSYLIGLLKAFCNTSCIPYNNDVRYIEYIEKENKHLLRLYYEERSQRRVLEEDIMFLQNELEIKEMNYCQLIRPMEELECEKGLENETDIEIVRGALFEKLQHLLVLETERKAWISNKRIEERQYKESKERSIVLEEMVNKMKEELQNSQERINALVKSNEEKDENNSVLVERNDELIKEITAHVINEKHMNDYNEIIKTKDLEIQELKDKLFNTEVINDFLETSIKDGASIDLVSTPHYQPSGEPLPQSQLNPVTPSSHHPSVLSMTRKHSLEVSQTSDVSKIEIQENQLNEYNNVCNDLIMFIYAICESCCKAKMALSESDHIIRVVSHLGSLSSNAHFFEDIKDIIMTANRLYDMVVKEYIEDTSRKVEEQLLQKEEMHSKVTRLYEEQIMNLKDRVQQLEAYESASMSMKTMVSLDEQEVTTVPTNSLSFLRKQNDNLSAANRLYIKQIADLSSRLVSFIDKHSTSGNDKDKVRSTLQSELLFYQSQCILWQTRADQLERFVGECDINHSCLTDNELAILSSVIDKLLSYVMDHLVLDMEIDISLETMMSEYNSSIKQYESRQPSYMETNVYCIETIVEITASRWMERKYQLEMKLEEEVDMRRELEMRVNRESS